MSELVQYRRDGHVGVISLNNPPVNALNVSRGLVQGVLDAVKEAEHDPAVRALLILGTGKAFSGGADIAEFGRPPVADRANLRDLVAYLDTVSKLVVAAIHGPAMGGGLELALACHYRAAQTGAQLGLPEVKLGLLPGAGGTQRLPRLIGAVNALGMIVTGDPVSTERALELGIVDEILEGDLLKTALACVNRLLREGRAVRRSSSLVATPAPEGAAFFAAERARIARDQRGYPAPLACLDCVQAAVELPFSKGVQRERELFQGLHASSESSALIHVFFSERQAAKVADVPEDTPASPIRSAAVLGAGTMGGGIAMNFANAGIPVRILEQNQEGLDRGLAVVRKNYAATVAKGRLSQAEMDRRLGLMSGILDYKDLADADIVIEAVFEDMAVKKQVFQALDAHCKPGAVLATNTSTLDVDEIAAMTRRPEAVLGLHFFSPANVMRLLEVVRGGASSAQTIATGMKLARTLKKVGVLVGVCDGFVGNRMVHAYFREAAFLLEEGALPQQVDRVLETFGFAMGPFRVGDLAGLDVGWYIRKRQAATRPANQRYSVIADRICERGRYGQKTGAGYYRYEAGNRNPIPDPEIEALIIEASQDAGIARREISDEEILQRCLYQLVNEGAKILEEGIAQRASDIDIVYVFGYGFPRFRGGPMFHADTVGLPEVLAVVERFHAAQGEFWTPAPLLRRLAQEGGRFNPRG